MNENTVPLTFWQTITMHLVVEAPALLIAYMAYRAANRAKDISKENKNAIHEVHVSINSRMDAYLATTKQAGIEQGAKQEGEKRDAKQVVFEAGAQSELDKK